MAGDAQATEVPAPVLDGGGLRVALIVARFNSQVTARLLAGARQALADLGVAVTETWVPGAFEIPFAALHAARAGADAVVCIGCVIRGETSHYDLVAGQCAEGIMRVGLDTGVPVIFSVLTTENLDQAMARSVIPGDGRDGHNAGADGAAAAVEMAHLART
jgi:6,7-dimethyl-8-ribityllumazine synthase